MKTHATGHHSRGRFSSIAFVVALANHLSVVQTVVAAAKVAFVMALLSIPAALPAIAVGLVTFAVYNANNLTDLDEDAVNRPRCAAFVRRHRRSLAATCLLAGLTALGIAAAFGGPLAVAIMLVPVVTGVLYSVPVVPFEGAPRLKDVFAINTILVAGAWAVTVTYVPVAMVGDVAFAVTLPVCTYLFLRTVISVEVFNVRDVDGDRAGGVATLPASLGVPETVHTLLVLDVAALAIVVGAADLLPAFTLTALVPITVLSMAVTVLLEHVDNVDLLCLLKDGEYLALGSLVFLPV